MFQLGLIGKSLKHSFSAGYFAEKFARENITNIQYDLLELKHIDEVQAILNRPECIGLNVTIPYKTSIIPFLYKIDPVAQKIGAVNCLARTKDGWVGYNTDYIGFKKSLLPLLKPQDQTALILGNGGASKAIEYVLKELHISFKVVGRTGNFDIHWKELKQKDIDEAALMIQCTPIGMFPHEQEHILPAGLMIRPNQICYDLIYRPDKTTFLQLAEISGARIKNGWEMLVIQAEESWQIWQPLCVY